MPSTILRGCLYTWSVSATKLVLFLLSNYSHPSGSPVESVPGQPTDTKNWRILKALRKHGIVFANNLYASSCLHWSISGLLCNNSYTESVQWIDVILYCLRNKDKEKNLNLLITDSVLCWNIFWSVGYITLAYREFTILNQWLKHQADCAHWPSWLWEGAYTPRAGWLVLCLFPVGSRAGSGSQVGSRLASLKREGRVCQEGHPHDQRHQGRAQGSFCSSDDTMNQGTWRAVWVMWKEVRGNQSMMGLQSQAEELGPGGVWADAAGGRGEATAVTMAFWNPRQGEDRCVSHHHINPPPAHRTPCSWLPCKHRKCRWRLFLLLLDWLIGKSSCLLFSAESWWAFVFQAKFLGSFWSQNSLPVVFMRRKLEQWTHSI